MSAPASASTGAPSPAASQIVHESEAQRQHVRLSFPARVEVAGQVCTIRDLSSGGLAVRGLSGVFTRGQCVSLRLILPFGSFTMDIRLEAETRHFSPTEKLTGFRFIDLTSEQISLLNHVLKAYMAGDIVTAGDVMNVLARDNFVEIRRQHVAANSSVAGPDMGGQLLRLAVVAAIGIIVVAFVLGNLYEKIFVLKTANAAVGGPLVEITAYREGIYRTALPPDAVSVRPAQPLGEIRSLSGDVVQAIVSPCDCYIIKAPISGGSFVAPGMAILSLIPVKASSWVTAMIDPALAARLEIGDQAAITIAGSSIAFTGQIAAIESGLTGNRGAGLAAHGTQPLPASIRIAPDQRIPLDMISRPAHVAFRTR